jgi:hypothetical protein
MEVDEPPPPPQQQQQQHAVLADMSMEELAEFYADEALGLYLE